MICQGCSEKRLHLILDLGHHPPSDAFLTEEQLHKEETLYPVKLFFCESCKLVQLNYAVDPRLLFTDQYVYTSSSNAPFRQHLHELGEHLINKVNLDQNDLVVDIGSNDGTFLEKFVSKNIKSVGVDPSNPAKVAIGKGIDTINNFFNEETAKAVLQKYGKAKLITALNVFQHVKELESLINGVKLLLEDSGVFLIQSHYLLNLVKDLQYDSIYLEHLRYYSLTSLINILNLYGFDVFDAEHVDIHGGSIRVFACIKGNYPISNSVKQILEKEEEYGLNSLKTFEEFRKRVYENRSLLKKLLHEIKSEGNIIYGIGAPAKGNTLLNFCKIDSDILDCLLEINEFKIGKYSPGMHIKVLDESFLFRDKPEYALLLPWNIKDTLIRKLREKGYTGKIIVSIPRPTVVQ